MHARMNCATSMLQLTEALCRRIIYTWIADIAVFAADLFQFAAHFAVVKTVQFVTHKQTTCAKSHKFQRNCV